ncbi:MAG: hypothetical protein DRG30_05505, partial [Epsilonproteobacteria bacterium]
MKLSILDVRKNINSTYCDRGMSYYNIGRVTRCLLQDNNSDNAMILLGSVKGSGMNLYSQEIKINYNQGIIIRGECS